MNTTKITLIGILLIGLSGCASSKTGMEYEQLPNGHTKVIDYDKRTIIYIDHSGRVYKEVCIEHEH